MSSGVTGRFFPTFGHHLGAGGTLASFNESTLNNGGAGPYAGHLGQVVEQDGKVYRLVQFDNGTDNVAAASGSVAYWKDRSSYIVTSDYSSGVAVANGVCGAFLGVITDQYYCYVQMGGNQGLLVNTTCAAGSALTSTTTDGTLVAITTNTLGTQLIVAISHGTNTTTSCNAYWVLGAVL